jgi:hypothetical protein
VDDVNVIVDISGLVEGTYSCQLTVTGSGAPNSPQIVDVNLVIYQPVIGLSATQFDFTAYEDGANPTDQILGISNSGTGILDWTIVEGCSWLSAEPNRGSNTGEVDDVNLSVDITGLAGGTYNCQLTIADSNASNNPQIVDVNLVVIGPEIGLSATQFNFIAFEWDANPNDQILSISNSGGGILNWKITEGCGWLTVEPNSGSSTGEVDDVNLSVDITGLAGGTYNCKLTISDPNAANNAQRVRVSLYIGTEDELHVPSEYPTIQAAIDAAIDGNMVTVLPGTYTGAGNRDIDFLGKAITVRGVSGPANCIIDCNGSPNEPHRGFYFHNGEGPNSILSGLTITNGYSDECLMYNNGGGGAIRAWRRGYCNPWGWFED